MVSKRHLVTLIFGMNYISLGHGQTLEPSPVAHVLYGDPLQLTCHLGSDWIGMMWDRGGDWVLTALRGSCGNNKTQIGYFVSCHGDFVQLYKINPTDGTSYKCWKSIGNSQNLHSNSTTVDIYVEGPYLETNQDTISVKETDNAELICTARGGPNINITWTRVNSTEVLPSQSTAQGTLLTMGSVSRDQAGIYTCHGSFTYQGMVFENQTSMELNVLYSPSVTVQGGGTVRNGTSTTLVCSIDANPTATHVVWRHYIGSDLIRQFNGSGGHVENSLVLSEVQYQDSGTYLCTASNGIISIDNMTEQSNATVITVQHSPLWLDNNVSSVYFKEKNTQLLLTYRYLANPKTSLPVVMEADTNTSLINGTRFTILSRESHELLNFYGKHIETKTYVVDIKFNPILATDTGKYVLRVENEVSYNERSFTVNAIDMPVLPADVRFEVLSYSIISVHWSYEYDVDEFLSFLVICKTKTDDLSCGEKRLVYKDTQSEYTYELTKLRPDTLYSFSICSENPLGKRCTTTLSAKTKEITTIEPVTPASQSGTIEENINKGTIIVVAVMASVAMVTLLCIVLILKLYRRRRQAIPKDRASGLYGDDTMNSSERRAIANNYIGKPALPARGKMSITDKCDYDEINTGATLQSMNVYEQIPADLKKNPEHTSDSKGNKKKKKKQVKSIVTTSTKSDTKTFSDIHNEYSSLILTTKKLSIPEKDDQAVPKPEPSLNRTEVTLTETGYLTPGELPQETSQWETNTVEKTTYMEMGDSKSTIGNQPSTISNQPSTIGNQPSTIGNQPSTIGNQPSTIGYQSNIGNQPSTIGYQSTIGNQPSTKSGTDSEQRVDYCEYTTMNKATPGSPQTQETGTNSDTSDLLEKCEYTAMNKVTGGQNEESVNTTSQADDVRFDAYQY